MFDNIRTIRIKDAHAAAIIEQLMQMNALEFMDANTDFVLSAKQIALLDKRSKTPIEKCITAGDSVKQLKKKYGI
jgi:hypothetical protein